MSRTGQLLDELAMEVGGDDERRPDGSEPRPFQTALTEGAERPRNEEHVAGAVGDPAV